MTQARKCKPATTAGNRSPGEPLPGDVSPRLTILETLREYGMERLEERGKAEAARDAHAAHVLVLAETAHAELRGSARGT